MNSDFENTDNNETMSDEENLVNLDDDLVEGNEGSTDESSENSSNEETPEETKGSGINYSKAVVRNEHGVIDLEATVARFESELSAFAATETDTAVIAEAVQTVYKRMPAAQKQMIDMTGLVNRALTVIASVQDIPYGADAILTKRIKDFVRGESVRFKTSKGEEGKYCIRQGRGMGGVHAATPLFVKEWRASEAKKAAEKAKSAAK